MNEGRAMNRNRYALYGPASDGFGPRPPHWLVLVALLPSFFLAGAAVGVVAVRALLK